MLFVIFIGLGRSFYVFHRITAMNICLSVVWNCAQHLLLLFVLRGKNHITLVFVIGSMATTVDEDECGGIKSADRGE